MPSGVANVVVMPIRKGFGLIELIVTISIVAILMALALPNFQGTLNSNRTTSQANDLIGAFNLARNEAISRNRVVTVCAADTRSGTPTDCGAATGWNLGWMVYVDTVTSNAAPVSVAAANVLRTGSGDASIAIAANAAFVRYSSRGEVMANADRTLTFKPASNCKPGQARQLTISLIGRIGTSRLTTCP